MFHYSVRQVNEDNRDNQDDKNGFKRKERLNEKMLRTEDDSLLL